MSPIPPFVAELRELVGQRELWMPGVTAVVEHQGRVLLTRRADNGEWAPITGILDPGEEPARGAAREAMEECCVEIEVRRLASVGVSPRIVHANGDRAVYLDLTFHCAWLGGEARVGDDENVEVRWWPADELPAMKPELRHRIDVALAGQEAARFLS